jgi:hypothetical protein
LELLDAFAPQDSSGVPISLSWNYMPDWWSHYNGLGEFKWSLTLPAGKSADLGYTWNYFWR